MKIAVCIEKSGGMLFNKRRVSQDGAVRKKLLEIAGDGKLYLNCYSAKQFESTEKLCICSDFLSRASEQDLCFVEDTDIPFDAVTQIYLFRWNRDYPADRYWNGDPQALGFEKISTEHFAGSSHKKITLDVYQRRSSS